jgi:hypothetical protein
MKEMGAWLALLGLCLVIVMVTYKAFEFSYTLGVIVVGIELMVIGLVTHKIGER